MPLWPASGMGYYADSDERWKDEALARHEAAAALGMTYKEHQAVYNLHWFIVRLMNKDWWK